MVRQKSSGRAKNKNNSPQQRPSQPDIKIKNTTTRDHLTGANLLLACSFRGKAPLSHPTWSKAHLFQASFIGIRVGKAKWGHHFSLGRTIWRLWKLWIRWDLTLHTFGIFHQMKLNSGWLVVGQETRGYRPELDNKAHLSSDQQITTRWLSTKNARTCTYYTSLGPLAQNLPCGTHAST